MTSIQSVKAERDFKLSVQRLGGRLVTPTGAQIKLAASRLSEKRRKAALFHLAREYSSLAAVPAGELVDRLFGLDVMFTYRGVTYGVDVTLDPSAVYSKQQKLQSLRSAHAALGVQKTRVFCPTNTTVGQFISSLL